MSDIGNSLTHRADAALDRAAWDGTRRVEGWAGEVRVNAIRLVAVVLFYGRHLVEYFLAPPDAPVRAAYHLRVTAVAFVWAAAAVLLHVLLSRRRVPAGLRYATVLVDGLLITILCAIAGGPRTSLVLLYFLLIASAPLRLCLRLVYVATAAAIGGYLFLLGYYAWFLVGFERYYSTPELRVPRSEQVVMILALLVMGLFAGQLVRQARRIAAGHPATPVPREEG